MSDLTFIEKNDPEAGLERLHSFVTKLIRTLAERQGVAIETDKPLHSMFDEYVKAHRNAGLTDSGMTERTLKTSISIMGAFNEVRNEENLAHDNGGSSSSTMLESLTHFGGQPRRQIGLLNPSHQPNEGRPNGRTISLPTAPTVRKAP